MRKQADDDDPILRDGERMTFPMPMMDQKSRELVEQARRAFDEAPPPVLSLADARARADKARAAYLQQLTDAWRPRPAA